MLTAVYDGTAILDNPGFTRIPVSEMLKGFAKSVVMKFHFLRDPLYFIRSFKLFSRPASRVLFKLCIKCFVKRN